jgi:2-keto-4-pentenoate hydratase/2-oxohepta-3-ene-1,7-dioic acid hydratase in catechol pathway
LERIENPHDLLLDLSINGKVIQHDTTNNMIHNIPRIIEFVSGFMTLNPGDLFLTGTPSGVGVLAVGDLLDARLIQKDHVLA